MTEKPKSRGGADRVRVRDVLRGAIAIARKHGGLLFAVALVLFIPLGLLDAADEAASELDLDELDDLTVIGLFAASVMQAVVAMVGEAFFAGIVAAVVLAHRTGERHGLAHVARTVPYGRLIAIDLLFSAAVVVGLLLLVLPGLVLATWYALAAPVAKIERRGVRDSFRRSRELVRGNFWTVFAIAIPFTLLIDALATGGDLGGHWIFGETFAGDWAGAVLADMIFTTAYATAVVVLTFALIERRAE